MIKILLFFLTTLFFLVPQNSYADNKLYEVFVKSQYTVNESGNTAVVQEIELINKTEFQFAPSYEVYLGFSDIQNVKAFNAKSTIPHIVKSSGDKQSILISFKERVVGKGKKNRFTVSYETRDIAQKKGSIWDVSIPGVSNIDTFSAYDTTLIIPSSFGAPAIIKPEKTVAKNSTFTFTKEEIGKGGISVMFGVSQAYSFALTYHLKNDNLFPVTSEIALPPTTGYQDVIIQEISPRPIDVTMDEDGNWLATYNLKPQEDKTIQVTGHAKIFADPRPEILSSEKKTEYLKEQNYWEQDNRIQKIAQETKTPRKIYEYVVNTLQYDYKKVTESGNRLGAKNVFSDNASTVCLEFTDLFIAIARAAGIPARAVEGYAYTDDSTLRPLALRQDILHAWPEYYDESKKSWIMVDPTWGNTTKGTDYFSSLDFYHLAFVVKGYDSTYPVPAGGYKNNPEKKDVQIDFVEVSSFDPKQALKLSSSFPDFSMSGLPATGKVLVQNTGSAPIRNKKLVVLGEDAKSWEYTVDLIPPYGKKEYTVTVPTGNFLTNKTHRLRISIDDVEDFRVFRTGVLPENSQQLVMIGGVLVVSIITSAYIALKTRRI
jgi:transglutaminase-like putative cysteine protease